MASPDAHPAPGTNPTNSSKPRVVGAVCLARWCRYRCCDLYLSGRLCAVLCCAAGSARAGKSGVGLLLLCDWEQFFLKGVRDLPLKPWQGGSIPLDTRPGERE
eukprot:SAG25_NODE_9594_length_366_cov_0.779026_1_plen_102_part_10